MNNRIGVDIGGTYIKFIVLCGSEIIYRNKVKTAETGYGIVDSIYREYRIITDKLPVVSIGIGVPGEIKKGFVTAENLSLLRFPLGKLLKEKLEVPIFLENDANCAAIGELYFGVAVDCKNFLVITLGTGIGGGIIIDRKIYYGNGSAGEVGHIIIMANQGKKCTCGQIGCWEQYASTAALLRQAEYAASHSQPSLLNKTYENKGKKLDGESFFDVLKQGCPIAQSVFEQYLHYLAVGIDSVANILAPEMIVLSGGITEEADILINGLRKVMYSNVCVKASLLKNDAGAMGAAVLSN